MNSPSLLFLPPPQHNNEGIPQSAHAEDPFMDLPDPTGTHFSSLTAHPFPLATPMAFWFLSGPGRGTSYSRAGCFHSSFLGLQGRERWRRPHSKVVMFIGKEVKGETRGWQGFAVEGPEAPQAGGGAFVKT